MERAQHANEGAGDSIPAFWRCSIPGLSGMSVLADTRLSRFLAFLDLAPCPIPIHWLREEARGDPSCLPAPTPQKLSLMISKGAGQQMVMAPEHGQVLRVLHQPLAPATFCSLLACCISPNLANFPLLSTAPTRDCLCFLYGFLQGLRSISRNASEVANNYKSAKIGSRLLFV